MQFPAILDSLYAVLCSQVSSVKACKQVSWSELQFYSTGVLQLKAHLQHDNLHMALPDT